MNSIVKNKIFLALTVTVFLLVGGYWWYFQSSDYPAVEEGQPTTAQLWTDVAPSRTAGSIFKDRLTDGGEGPEMVQLPTSSFMMGSSEGEDNEKPVHRVAIDQGLAMMRHEVTFADYDQFVAATGKTKRINDDEGWGRGTRPVINVSWQDANDYAKWLSQQTGKNYRLPSEAEWEYAARAGSTKGYSWGNNIGSGRANCNDCDSQLGDSKTALVKSFSANAFGLYDMHGNVWEWTQDCWNDSYRLAPDDGAAWLSGNCARRVLRGGSWYYEPRYLGAAGRLILGAGSRIDDNGFRLVQG